VEGRIEQPEAIESAAQVEALNRREETAGSKIRLPFLEGVYLLVLLRNPACCYDLSEQSVGNGYVAMDVGRLRGVLCNDLNDVIQRSVFGFCGVREDQNALAGVEDVAKVLTCRRERESRVNGW